MSSALPVVLFGLGGLLAGGALSVRKQGGGLIPVVALAVLAGLAVAGGLLWLAGKD